MPELTPDDVRAIVHEELNAFDDRFTKKIGDRLADFDDRITNRLTEFEDKITERLTETMRDIETRLLSAFHTYATASDIRFRKLESNEGNNSKAVELRLANLEEQVRALEGRIQKGGM